MVRERKRDDRDFDTTSLHAKASGISLARDYSAHFFRWSFARRFIKRTDSVLEVGCGVERPLFRILCTETNQAKVDRYLGVDLNRLPEWKHGRAEFIGEFNFVERWKELVKRPQRFDVAVNLEVIEHMKPEHGRAMLRGIRELLRPGGALLLSTPCYDGVHHAANHIHEYTVPELSAAILRAGFRVERRFGTFMNVLKLPKGQASDLDDAVARVAEALVDYYDHNAISCIFAPLYPDKARNNLWVCRKPGG